ncbi:MAG: hypothetical protein NTU41_09910, partial [Chloroflexi bacterium]|nr:hypothetical protein [Chloroflexota bacterium]
MAFLSARAEQLHGVSHQRIGLFDNGPCGPYTFLVKPLHMESDRRPLELECAALLMDVVPLVMRRIRMEMRRQGMPGLSVPQLRALIYLYRNEGASHSELAEHIGLGLPSMSKM